MPTALPPISAPSARRPGRLPWWLGGTATLGACLLLLALLAVAGPHLARDAETAERWVEHTLEVLAETGYLFGAVQDAETGVGGYLLTLDPGHLAPFEAGRAAVRDHLARVRRLVRHDAAQQERLAALEAAVAARMAVLDRVLGLARGGERAAALALVRRGEGRRHMLEVRRLIQEVRTEEDHLLLRRRQEAAVASRRMAWNLQLTAVTALLVVLGGVADLLVLGRQRRRAERTAALAEGEARLRRALDELGAVYGTVPVGLGLVDRDFRFRSINAALAGINGLPVEAHLGRTVAEVLPELWPVLEPLYRAVLESGEPILDLPVSGRTPSSGEERHWLASYVPVRDERSGAVWGVSVTVRDVTEQRRAEAALAEGEARFRAMADNIPQLAWMARPDGRIFWYNRRWFDHTGTTLEQMQGWGWRAVHHPDHLGRVEAGFRRCLEAGEPWEDTFPLRGADGGWRWFLSRAEPVRDAEGRITLWFGTNTDVTGQRRAEEGNAHLATLVASAGDAIVSFAAEDGRILSWNRGAESLFGYTRAEAVGGPAGLLVPPERPEGDPTGVFAWAMSGRTVHDHETVRVAKDGERIPVSVTAAPMVAADGRVIGVSAIFRDLRARKAAEEHQALLMREVDHRARNVLAVVQSVLRMTRAEDQRGYVAAVEGRIAALGRAHGLLASGRWSGAELRHVAEEELAAFRGDGARGDGRVALSGPPVHLVAEAVQPVAMVLHEMATNAARHGALSRPEGLLLLSWGLDPATGELRLAWEERGGPPVRGVPAARGFGSALITATVRGQLGGSQGFDWRPEGLRCGFTIAARHLRSAAPAASEATPGGGAAPTPAALPAGCRVLVAEDETLVALELQEGLAELGCAVLGPAATLTEALRLAAMEPPPDAAILDINLAGKASFPVADLLLGLGVPVLFASGYGELPPERAGQAPLLRKPLARGELEAALRRLLGERGGDDTAAAATGAGTRHAALAG